MPHTRAGTIAAPAGTVMQQRIEKLEVKVAFLEEANSQLSDMVYRQQMELQALRAQLMDMTSRLEAAQSRITEYTAEQEKPPHY
jgi:SlyX protein